MHTNNTVSFSVAVCDQRSHNPLGPVRAVFPVLFSADCDLVMQLPDELDVDGTCGKQCMTAFIEDNNTEGRNTR